MLVLNLRTEGFQTPCKGRIIVKKIRADCSKCRILQRQTLELAMQPQKPERTCISPPFFNVQIDIAMGFDAKPFINARKHLKAHALVIVCLLSSGTSIHVLEDLSTASVVQALERHSSRYGIPFKVFCDPGSNLVKLKDCTFSLKDVSTDTHNNLGFEIQVQAPKAHFEVGRVEAKVKLLKEMLNKLFVTKSRTLTYIGWETVFQRIASMLDNVPMCKIQGNDDPEWRIMTPNRLKIGRNNHRSLDSPMMLTNCPQTLLERNQLIQETWYNIFISKIHYLIPQPKWHRTSDIEVEDIVLFLFEDGLASKLNTWRIGKVVGKEKSKLLISYKNNITSDEKVVKRNPRHVSKIFSSKELGLNTTLHYKKVSRSLRSN